MNSNNKKAYVVSIIAGLIAAPLIFIAWVVIMLSFYFADGGDFGGMGVAAQAGDGSLSKGPAPILVTLIACGIEIFIVVGVFKHMSKKATNNTTKPNSSFKIILIALSIPIIIILGLSTYSYYLKNRTGALNPYTDICINSGSKGAKGDYCVD